MTNYNLEEAELIKVQMILSAILILTTFVSISLSYNSWLILNNEEPIYNDKETEDILLFNRFIMFVLALIFIYINIRDKNVKEECGLDDEFSDLQILASAFSLVAAAIVLYVGACSSSNIISEENPTI